MTIQKCLRCDYEWESRVKYPLTCPRCKRYDWNTRRKENDSIEIQPKQ